MHAKTEIRVPLKDFKNGLTTAKTKCCMLIDFPSGTYFETRDSQKYREKLRALKHIVSDYYWFAIGDQN